MNAQKVIKLKINSLAELHNCYMPFLKNGGLFIIGNDEYQMEEEISITLHLLQEIEPLTLNGKVAWITPQNAQNARRAGVGVQFIDDVGKTVQQKISDYLRGYVPEKILTETI